MRIGHRLIGPRIAATCAAAMLGGCGPGDGTGLDEGGRPPGESGAADGSDFGRIQQTIFTPICTQCHAGAAAPLGLRLDVGNSFAQLVDVPSAQVSGLRRVSPGDPNNSYLVQKVEGRAAVGARMPLGGPPLPQASIDLIRSWIAAGAPAGAVAPQVAKAFQVTSTIPADGESAAAGLREISIVLSAAADASLLLPGSVLLQSGERPVAIAGARVAPWNAGVLLVRTESALAPGRYTLMLRGTGVPAFADVDARVLDGDGDGRAGGDFTLRFEVDGGAQ